jgi:signal transduction histidine kinase
MIATAFLGCQTRAGWGALLGTKRRAALERLSDRILEIGDLRALTRCLTEDLPRALGAKNATLLLWDRRLASFEGIALTKGGRLHTFAPQAADREGPRPRWLLAEGQLLETAGRGGEGTLLPLLTRSGLAGTLILGPVPRRRRPMSDGEARLVSLLASRAALSLEHHVYQKELIASERLAALGTVAGMLAHDFRGPITVIRGYAETLLEPGLGRSEVKARARLIVDAVDRLERMTQETLDFARGAERLVVRPVSLGLLLSDLAAAVELELPGLTLVRRYCVPSEHQVTLDVDKLKRAVLNIAANAREAQGGRGVLTITARLEPTASGATRQLVLELADDGPGVPPEISDRLFEPFVTAGKKRGTGLGLAVARRFVEDHGGSLELLPPPAAPARGACFRLALPIVAAGPETAAR